MGDPHHNTWGGKNNTWGNKNRKGRSSSKNTGNNSGGDFNKFGKVFLGTCVILALSQTGLGFIPETIGNISDALDFGKSVKEVTSSNKTTTSSNSTKSTKQAKKDLEKSYDDVDYKIDIEAQDVVDILEYISDSGNTSKTSVVFVDYEKVFKNDKNYNKNIVKKLNKYDDCVQFVAMNPQSLSEDEMKAEYERIGSIVNSNKELPIGAYFSSVSTRALYNNPSFGDLTIVITFE